MQIAGVFCVNGMKKDDIMTLYTYSILLFSLFCDFILSNKKN